MDYSERVLVCFLREFLASDLFHSLSPRSRLPCTSFSLAYSIIITTLEAKWTKAHLRPFEDTCTYFTVNRERPDEMLQYMGRIVEFGELIYNLNNVQGFSDRIVKIRNDMRTGVEAGIAELIGGKLFRTAGVLFIYSPEQSEPGGRNPDIEYVAGLGRLENCEVKTVLHDAEFSSRTIQNALKSKWEQLPKGGAGSIILRVPSHWVNDEQKQRNVEMAIQEFIRSRKTSRLSSIFILMSQVQVLNNDKMAEIFAIKEFRNEHCSKGSGVQLPNFANGTPNWIKLRSLAESALIRAGMSFSS